MDKQVEEIKSLLSKCSSTQRKVIFAELRKEFNIHPIESKLNTVAELILEAMSKDDKGLTFRMMRGVIAEAAFRIEVLSKLEGWKEITPSNSDLSYDYKLSDHEGELTVQIKLQRSKDFHPMLAKQAYRKFSENLFVVETQKTRGGKDRTESNTRPYKYKEFDILGVSMQPSTGSWADFMYTVSDWLIPQGDDPSRILKFQPVAMKPNKDWTNDFETCVMWFRQKIKNTIDS
ncbi:MAG: hypothetical protein WDN75_11850 [Bacteroidota bacterium]